MWDTSVGSLLYVWKLLCQQFRHGVICSKYIPVVPLTFQVLWYQTCNMEIWGDPWACGLEHRPRESTCQDGCSGWAVQSHTYCHAVCVRGLHFVWCGFWVGWFRLQGFTGQEEIYYRLVIIWFVCYYFFFFINHSKICTGKNIMHVYGTVDYCFYCSFMMPEKVVYTILMIYQCNEFCLYLQCR